jgi:L-lactate dehydrogenase complex protein LldG
MEWRKVGGSTARVASLEELERSIREILDAVKATSVVLSRNPLLAQLGLGERLRAWRKSVVAWPSPGSSSAGDEGALLHDFKGASFSAAVGITGVDFALAESGSLVLTSLTEGSQLSSLAPPIHVALYRRSQAVGSLDEVLAKLPISSAPGTPAPGRSVVFITGPSRTADIEQILIRGVHGPGEVHAILVEESCLG